jgi:hypothetical protein
MDRGPPIHKATPIRIGKAIARLIKPEIVSAKGKAFRGIGTLFKIEKLFTSDSVPAPTEAAKKLHGIIPEIRTRG